MYIINYTLYTSRSHASIFINNCTVYTVQCTIYSVHLTLYNVRCTVYTYVTLQAGEIARDLVNENSREILVLGGHTVV